MSPWGSHPSADVSQESTSTFGLLSRRALTWVIAPSLPWMLTRQLDAELLRPARLIFHKKNPFVGLVHSYGFCLNAVLSGLPGYPVIRHVFKQVDVFAEHPFKGNPVAVILDADGLSDDQMASIARWTNLSETTFVLKPTDPGADYRVRIFTTLHELPFAGHPTLGTCRAWLEAGGTPRGEEIVQECAVGRVRIRRDGDRLAFTAPPLLVGGPVPAEQLDAIRVALGVDPREVLDAQWVDNGAGWLALRLAHPEVVLRIRPDFSRLGDVPVGVFAAYPADEGLAEFEARAFIAGDAMPEDPVTGSLMAGIAQWLAHERLAPDHYVVNQGRVLGRAGRIHVDRRDGDIWIGGHARTLVDGAITIPSGD